NIRQFGGAPGMFQQPMAFPMGSPLSMGQAISQTALGFDKTGAGTFDQPQLPGAFSQIGSALGGVGRGIGGALGAVGGGISGAVGKVGDFLGWDDLKGLEKAQLLAAGIS